MSNEVDIVENGAIVKVFLLEAPLPSNAGDDIMSGAGPFWEGYGPALPALVGVLFFLSLSVTASILTVNRYRTNGCEKRQMYHNWSMSESCKGSTRYWNYLEDYWPCSGGLSAVDVIALTHAALGFVVELSQAKHVLELYAHDYVGSFLPDLPPLPPTPTPSPSTDAPAGGITSSPTVPVPAPSGTPSPTATPTSLETPSPGGGNASSSSSSSSPTTPGENESSVFTSKGWRDGEAASDLFKDVRGGGGSGNGNGTAGDLVWGNDATLLPTSGFDPNMWATANYVGKITGLLFNDLSGWANSYRELNPRYQPLSACSGNPDGPDGGDFSTKGSADSYDFIWAAFERLASNGFIFEQQVVLPPRRTVMCIFPEGGVEAVDHVEAEGNQEIEDYFRATGDCVRKLAAAAAAGNTTYPGAACASDSGDGWAAEGGVSVLLGISDCLHGQSNAYLYHNETSYLRLPLPAPADGNKTFAASATPRHAVGTARLVRYVPALPQPPPNRPAGPDRAYIVYIAVGVAVIGLAIAGLTTLYRRSKKDGRGGRVWRGGGFGEGSADPDFGDFDSVGGGYEGALFPADNYSSGGLSGSRSFGSGVGGRIGNWRGGRSPSETAPLEAETVQLKRPLLNLEDNDAEETHSRRSFRGGGSAHSEDPRSDARRQGDGGRGRGKATSRGIERDQGRSSGGAESPPPPFSRMVGPMGGDPQLSDGKSNKPRRPKGGAVERGRGAGGKDDRGLDGKPLREGEDGDDDDGDDPFAADGGGSGKAGSLRKDDGLEGDEVFC